MKNGQRWIAGVVLGLSGLVLAASAQDSKPPAPPAQAAPTPALTQLERQSGAYYHFTMGKVFEEYFEATGRADYATQAIDAYKKAYELDPRSAVIGERLAEMYAKSQRIRDAVTEAQEILRRDPENLGARRLLARIYLRTLGNLDPSVGQRETVTRAIEQFEEIVKRDAQDGEAAVWLARLYRLRNEHERALDVLKTLVQAQPENEEAVQQYAQLLVDLGKGDEAIRVLERATSHSFNAELFGLLGEAYLQARDSTRAEVAFRRAMELERRDPSYRRGLARALQSAGKLREALDEYLKLIELDPDEQEPYLRAAQIYRQLKELDEAEEILARARERSPGNLELLYNEAMLFEAQGRFDDAIRLLSDAVARVKAGPGQMMDSRRTLGVLYEQLGRLYREVENFSAALNTFQEMGTLGGEEQHRARELTIDTLRASKQLDRALEESQKALAGVPQDRGARVTHALLLGEKGATDEAAAMLRELLVNSREDRGVYLALSQVYERGKRWKEAEAAARSAERLAARPEENEMVFFMLGAIFERQGQAEKAEAEFRRALEVNPKSGAVLNYLGYMLAERGLRLEEAVAFIRRALDEEPHNAAYLDSLGWAYFKMSRFAEAEEFLRQAAERSTRDPEIRDHLGDLYAKTGRLDMAIAEWERALNEWKRAAPTELDAEKITATETKLRDAKQQRAGATRKAANPQ
jgi:tetratricopeptide (TPR) repeat protein